MTRPTLPSILATLSVLTASLVAGCTNYSDQLARAEQYYGNARYEAALTNLEDLEINLGSLSNTERVRYDLVRGMTHLRLDQRQESRHWLAIAREEARRETNALTETQRANIDRTITELDPLTPRPAAGTGGTSGGESSGSSGGSGTGSAAPAN